MLKMPKIMMKEVKILMTSIMAKVMAGLGVMTIILLKVEVGELLIKLKIKKIKRVE